jgi:hypothetical protein
MNNSINIWLNQNESNTLLKFQVLICRIYSQVILFNNFFLHFLVSEDDKVATKKGKTFFLTMYPSFMFNITEMISQVWSRFFSFERCLSWKMERAGN